MSTKKIFQTPTWDDDDAGVPSGNFNFKRKSKKKKPKPNQCGKIDIETYEPGRFVKLHQNADETHNKLMKRKLPKLDENEGVSEAKKKKRIRNGNEDKPSSIKLKKGKIFQFTKKTTAVDSEEDAPKAAPVNAFQEKLIESLKGSRFRYLNELLYSKPSNEASSVFQGDPTSFKAYHDGYRQQVRQWPLNPLDRIINALKRLPRNLVVADFGCGEARLAKSIPQKTYSLDLVAKTDDIIACDMANTPLETGTIDVVVFCLSLMGTNLKDFILEANRVLKDGGQLKIAEVESRFTDVRHFIANIKQCGFELVHQDSSNNLFYFLYFKKTKMVKKSNKTITSFGLKPCIYKKR